MRSALRKMLVGLAAASALASCQNYNVDPVSPGAVKLAKKPVSVVAHKSAPNIMFVVDRSASMTDDASGGNNSCADSTGAYDHERTTDCKWNNLLDAMAGNHTDPSDPGFVSQVFTTLSSGGDSPRLGLVTFSDYENGSGNTKSCTPGRLRVAVPNAATSTVDQIKSVLLTTDPLGATPTAATMSEIPNWMATTQDRDSYVILLTDGAPNCDSNINPTEATCGGDRCTYPCNPGNWGACGCNPTAGGSLAGLLCLDDDALVTAVGNLNSQNNIKTFVIGFGADVASTTGAAHDTLNRAAQAGGLPTGDATFSYYQASSGQALLDALKKILNLIDQGCIYNLDGPPASDKALQVVLVSPGAQTCSADSDCGGGVCTAVQNANQQNLCGSIVDPSLVSVTGAQVTIKKGSDACNTLSDSTPTNPAGLEFRYVSK